MVSKLASIAFAALSSSTAMASGEITVVIDSLTNVTGGGAMEACGRATHSKGKKPLLVTIRHDQSYYTTLTAANDVWCSVLKRWTYNGSIEVGAATLDGTDVTEFQAQPVKLSD